MVWVLGAVSPMMNVRDTPELVDLVLYSIKEQLLILVVVITSQTQEFHTNQESLNAK
jgi:hypothetical protein